MKHAKLVKQLPNCITTLNMLLGLTVLFLHLAHQGEGFRPLSCGLILIAVCLDALDGKLARSLQAESALGKQLDSFADFASFGLAPAAILLTHAAIRDMGVGMRLCLMFYAAAGAFRLARFNLTERKEVFIGLPITAAGFLMVILNIILHYSSALQKRGTTAAVLVFVGVLAMLMVSGIKFSRFGAKKIKPIRQESV